MKTVIIHKKQSFTIFSHNTWKTIEAEYLVIAKTDQLLTVAILATTLGKLMR